MTDIHLRPAVAADQPLIRQMVRAEDLDPTSLHWSHFLVAELDGEVVAASRRVLTDLLRGKLGFTGLVVSDYEAIPMINFFHRMAETEAEAGAGG